MLNNYLGLVAATFRLRNLSQAKACGYQLFNALNLWKLERRVVITSYKLLNY